MRAAAAIIGGTGLDERLVAMDGQPVSIPTPKGVVEGRVIEHRSKPILAIRRHSAGHKVPPHRVAYAALALGLKSFGVKACLSTAAVGSLRLEWRPGTLVAVSDFIDVSGRRLTLFDQEVRHQDFTEPFSSSLRAILFSESEKLGLDLRREGVYVNANGPRYETPAEIRSYKILGGDLVGMTAGSEAILMREAGVPYACVAIVTNLAAGMSAAPLAHGDVVKAMETVSDPVLELLLGAAVRASE